MTLNGVITVILLFFADFGSFRGRLRQSGQDRPIQVTENERIIDRHLRGIHPLLDYDASESQSMISMGLK